MEEKEQSPTEEAENLPEESKRSGLFLFVAIAVIVLVIISFVVGLRLLNPNKPKTIDEAIDDTLKGKQTENNFLYNNYAFVEAGNMWYTRWQKGNNLYTIPLRFNPRQVENVTIIGELDKRFDPKNLYITFDPRKEPFAYVALGAAELSINLVRALDAVPTAACAYNTTAACSARPIVTCQDEDKAVIFIREANETAVLLNGNCIVIQGDQMNLLKAVDRVLYIWYGIMPRSLG